MWRTQPAFAAKRRHTLPTPHLLGNQLLPLRPHFLTSLLSRHPATLLHPHSPLQDALHVALTLLANVRRFGIRVAGCPVIRRKCHVPECRIRQRKLQSHPKEVTLKRANIGDNALDYSSSLDV